MMGVILLTYPVVVSQFHVLSPVVLLTNLLLIPMTAVSLYGGLVLIVVDCLVPQAAFIPGYSMTARVSP